MKRSNNEISTITVVVVIAFFVLVFSGLSSSENCNTTPLIKQISPLIKIGK